MSVFYFNIYNKIQTLMNVYIYVLIDPRTDHVRYVGKTNKPNYRYNAHISDVKRRHTHSSSWINSLLKIGLKPKFEIIDTCSEDDWIFWEQHYISLYKSWNFKLTNHTIGGEGMYGYKHTQEWKDIRSEKYSGSGNPFYNKNHTIKTKNEMSNILITRYKDNPESNPMYGKHHSDKTKSIMSNLKQGLYDGVKNPRARPIVQYDLNLNLLKIWDYAKECADLYNMSRGNIVTAAKHNTTLASDNEQILTKIASMNQYIKNVDELDQFIDDLQQLKKELKTYKIVKGFIFKYT